VIDEKTIAGLAMDATKSFDTGAVSGVLNDKTEIDRNSLIALRCASGSLRRTGSLVKFGFGTNRAVVKRTWFRNLWYAECKLMSLDKASSINMTKSLVPKVALMVAGELRDNARSGG
jgi:hypothetical protein